MNKMIGLCVALCALQVTLHAQNWNLVPTNKPMFFKNRAGKVTTLLVRQSLKAGKDSSLYFYAAAADSEDENAYLIDKYPPSDSNEYIFYEPTFIGAELLMRQNGDHLLIDTNANDTFLIKPKALLNESWQFGPKSLHQARVTIKHYGNMYGITDSFKTILLNFGSTAKKLVISKTHGVVASEVHLFPVEGSDTVWYERTGDPRFTFRKLNDFEVGDIFHSYYSRDALYGGIYIDTVLKKSFSADSSKVYYKVKRLRERRSYYPEFTTLHHDTLNWNLNYKEEYILRGYPGILYPNGIEFKYYIAYDSSSFYKTSFMRHFREIIWSPSTHSYFAGAGSYHYYNPESENGPTYQGLRYYKKGNKEWGTKLVVSLPTLPERQRISIYPNPTEGSVHLDGISDETWLSIADLNGRLLMKARPENGILDLHELQPGMYFIGLEGGWQSPLLVTR